MHFTLCDYMMEIVQNAVESSAPMIRIRCEQSPDTCLFLVEDSGCGMTRAQLDACLNPFAGDSKKHPGRKMGLGIPLLVHCVTTAGGRWNVDSEPGRGTRVEAEFSLRHLDTPPLGDLVDLWVSALTLVGAYDMTIERVFRDKTTSAWRGYTLNRSEIKAVLGDLHTATSLTTLRQFIAGHEAELPLLEE